MPYGGLAIRGSFHSVAMFNSATLAAPLHFVKSSFRLAFPL